MSTLQSNHFLRKITAGVVICVALAISTVAQGAYESGSCTDGSFTVDFSGANFVTGLGWSTGTSRTISFSGSCSGCSIGPSIYGWANTPLVEYYIGRGGGTNRGSYSTSKGTFTLYTNSCNGPNITGTGPFTQYNADGDGSSSQNMGEHFSGWSSLGMGLSSQNYQIVAFEGWSDNTGSATASVSSSSWYSHWVGSGSATFTCGGSTTTTTTTSAPDTTPPSPPPTWASPPAATGSRRIAMSSTVSTDISNPVLYLFECTTDSDANSGWQESTTYEAQGLAPSTLYTFKVKARDSSPAQNETVWSSTASATTDPPSTDVEIIGDWETGTSHTQEPGTNRVLLFIAHAEEEGAIDLTSVRYGGQSMNLVNEEIVGSSFQAYAAAYILDEVGIVAAANDIFDPKWSTAPDNVSYGSVFLENVDQTAPVGPNDTNSNTSTNTITTDALSAEDGDMVIVAATCGNPSSYTLNNSFTEAIENSMTSSEGVEGYKQVVSPSTSETPSVTNDDSNRQVILGFVVQAALNYQNCAEVQAGGDALASDLDGDCYVDNVDLEIVAYYWLDDDCSSSGDCEGADFEPDDDVDFFDFSEFALQWIYCNDPEDASCTKN